MNKIAKVILGVAALAVVGTNAAYADGHIGKAIKARKAHMTLVGWQMGTLGAMAKGKRDYDAKAAQAAADNMLALSMMQNGSLWPKGSDSTANPGKTRAKIDAWQNYEKVSKAHMAWTEASKKMAAAAGGGLDSLKGAMGALGKSCGGCHKPFREPKKK